MHPNAQLPSRFAGFRERVELGLGLLSIGRTWGVAQAEPPPEGEARVLLARALDLGITVLDTAPSYGTSESRVGAFLSALPREKRAGLTVMTKAGDHWDEGSGSAFVDHSRDALVRSIDRSLKRLGRIDVLQIHKATTAVVAHPDVIAAIEHARACGIPSFGASVSDLEAGERALATGLYQALQFPFNVANQGLGALIPLLRGRGGVAITNRPFAMGGLIGGADAEAQARAAFRFVAEGIGGGIILTGTGKVAHLEANVAAFRDRSL